MAEAPPAEGEEKKSPPPLVKRSDSVIARDKQRNFSRGEVEDAIKRIASHRGIVGTVIVDKHCVPLRSSMDKASTQQYAAFITPLVHRAQMICLNHDPMNPMTMFRIRTNTTEVIVTPDEEHNLIAVQKNIITASHLAIDGLPTQFDRMVSQKSLEGFGAKLKAFESPSKSALKSPQA